MSRDYEIISLGWNCQPRTYLKKNELIADKKHGRKTMIFDISGHPTADLIKLFKSNFSDYFDNFEFDYYPPFKIDSWQIKKYHAIFNHDNDCEHNNKEPIQKRYQIRLNNFLEEFNSNKFLFFIHNLGEEADLNDINNLYYIIKELRGEKPFKLIIWALDKKVDGVNIDENICICNLIHPYKDASDWFKPEIQNKETKNWEKALCNIVKQEIQKAGFEVKTFKIPLNKKIKNFIRPILKNIFTITNEPEINAKVLILLGLKFKIKKLR